MNFKKIQIAYQQPKQLTVILKVQPLTVSLFTVNSRPIFTRYKGLCVRNIDFAQFAGHHYNSADTIVQPMINTIFVY